MQSEDQPIDRNNLPKSFSPGVIGDSARSSNDFFASNQTSTPIKTAALNFDRHRPQIAILIDGASLFYGALQLQLEIDYSKLLIYLKGDRNLLRAYFYTGSDRTNERQQGFLLWMRRNGYRVVTKELITLPDGSRKANLDVEIAIDMMTLGNYCDTIVLLSSTGDLSYAVNALSYHGVKIEVVSLRANTNDQLINLADRFVDLADIKDLIRKTTDGRSAV
jgi:uncharacterized LabA/DUF88 family protein